MEASMFAISSLRSMEIIDINTGAKLGYIKDLKVNCEEYRIEAITIPTQKTGWFSRGEDIEIPWERIRKIGIDVILVDGDESLEK